MKFWLGYIWHCLQTTIHKFWVAYYMFNLYPSIQDYALEETVDWRDWLWRAIRHDWTKYKWDEASSFAKHAFDLKKTEFGTPEYRNLLVAIKPAIDRHYARNDHHPEHWDGGYEAMSSIAKFEMICDWAAAVRRHTDGNLEHSIEINAERFGYDIIQESFLKQYAAAAGAL